MSGVHDLEANRAAYDRRWWILGVLCLSLVLVMVANASLNVGITNLSRELGASASDLQWIVDAYAIVFAGLLLPAGALGDRFGRKGALQLGLVVFGLASLAATVADSPGQVIACRAAMGVGAAFVMPGTLSILASVFPPAERPRAIAIWAAIAGTGGAIGILVSGFVLDHFWWGSIFFVNLPVVLLALVAGAVLLPTSRDPSEARLDGPGSLLSIAGLGSLVYACIEAPERGWTDAATLGWFGGAVALLAAFVAWERRSANPMLDLSLFGDRRFTMGCVVIFLGFLAMFSMFFVVTQYLQAVQGHSPLGAGIRLLPFSFAMVVSAPRSARFAERYGVRAVVTTGLVLIAAGMATMASLQAESPYAHFVLGGMLMGLGMGQTMPPSTGSIMSALPMNKAGVGSAVNDTTREVGAATGIAVLGSLLASQYRSSLDGATTGLDESVVAVARDGIGRALELSGEIGGSEGRALAVAARDAFLSGMRVTFVAAALAVGLAAVLARRLIPGVSRAVDLRDAMPDGVAAEVATAVD